MTVQSPVLSEMRLLQGTNIILSVKYLQHVPSSIS
jgi:hypothetical protein